MFLFKKLKKGGKVKSAKRTKKGKTVLSVPYQSSPASISKKSDKARTALKPGKRISKRGRKYTETRANRSDLRPKSGL